MLTPLSAEPKKSTVVLIRDERALDENLAFNETVNPADAGSGAHDTHQSWDPVKAMKQLVSPKDIVGNQDECLELLAHTA